MLLFVGDEVWIEVVVVGIVWLEIVEIVGIVVYGMCGGLVCWDVDIMLIEGVSF